MFILWNKQKNSLNENKNFSSNGHKNKLNEQNNSSNGLQIIQISAKLRRNLAKLKFC